MTTLVNLESKAVEKCIIGICWTLAWLIYVHHDTICHLLTHRYCHPIYEASIPLISGYFRPDDGVRFFK